MNDNAYARLGELLLDEVLLRVGIAQTEAAPASISMDFVVGTDPDSECVLVTCERINNPPLALRFPLPRG